MRNTIFFRIFSGYFITAALLSAAISILTFGLIREFYAGMLLNKLETVAGTAEPVLSGYIEAKKYEKADSYLKMMGQSYDVRITAVMADGTVIADSDKNPSEMDNHINRPEIEAVISGKEKKYTSKRFSDTTGEEMFYFASPEAEGTWVIRTSMYASDINGFLDGLKNKILQATGLVLILAMLISYFLSRRISAPLKKIADASASLASGDFDTRVDYEGKDELHGLADAFNKMAKELKTTVTALSGEKERLNTIISSVKEGLLVIDAGGKITVANKSASQILGFDRPEFKNYWECMAGKGFNAIIENALRVKSNHVAKTEINSRQYLCSVTYLEVTGEIITILYDVTEMEEFEKIKKDFVANVSHELRTPLTAIKGFAETLEAESESEEDKKYLNTIIRNSERLMNIVSDLLVISKLESSGGRPELCDTDLIALCEGVIKIIEPAAKKKKIGMLLKQEGAIRPFKADAFRLEQMLINLIDNAVKYTDSGSVTVSLYEQDGSAVIEVADTGSGIAKEHLPRIFERFYVADKSRSRKLGGTGLGLSIVKHIVLMHGGTINAESEAGKGSKFTVKLPIK